MSNIKVQVLLWKAAQQLIFDAIAGTDICPQLKAVSFRQIVLFPMTAIAQSSSLAVFLQSFRELREIYDIIVMNEPFPPTCAIPNTETC